MGLNSAPKRCTLAGIALTFISTLYLFMLQGIAPGCFIGQLLPLSFQAASSPRHLLRSHVTPADSCS